MFDIDRISEWRGQDVVDPDDRRVGRLEEVYYDNSEATPGFACVKTGLFGRRLSFVPLVGASMGPDHVRVAFPADQIKHAPSVEPDGALTPVEEAALFAHYGMAHQPVLPTAEIAPTTRLMRYHAQAAASHMTEVRQMAAADIAAAGQVAGDQGGPGLDANVRAVVEARLTALEARVSALEDRTP